MLFAGRAGQHADQFPAVGTPLIEDLLGGVVSSGTVTRPTVSSLMDLP